MLALTNAVQNNGLARRLLKGALLCLSGIIAGTLPALAVSPPSISTGSGSYTVQQNVTMSASTGAQIYYTLNGAVPTNADTLYTGSPVIVTSPTQINAIAYQSGSYSTVTTVFLDVEQDLAPFLTGNLLLRLWGGLGQSIDVGSPAPVLSWADLSKPANTGSANDATSSSGHRPVMSNDTFGANVSFDGSSQYFSLPSGFHTMNNGAYLFAVARPNAGSGYLFEIGNGSGSPAANVQMQLATSGANVNAKYQVWNSASGIVTVTSPNLSLGQFQLIDGVNTNNHGTCSINASPGTNGSQVAPLDTTRNNNFVGNSSGGSDYFNGQMSELLFYSQDYTPVNSVSFNDGVRPFIQAYLITKYQLLNAVPAAPAFTIATSTLLQPAQVVITSEFGAITHVTTDGTTPDASSPVYCGPIMVNFTQTIKAISLKNGVSSSVSSATYTLDSSQFPSPSSSTPTINLQLPAPSL